MMVISRTIRNEDIENRAININSIQANSLYYVNNNVDNTFLDRGKAIINSSIFSEHMREHGVTVTKGKSMDFLLMKFDYGTKEKTIGNIDIPKLSSNELREYYYKNGATVNWKYTDKDGKTFENRSIRYKMLMRGPGKAKEGECIFIKENLHKYALDYITMGLFDKMPQDNAKIVELSAYSTLITATAIDYITLPLNNIFVVKDVESSVFKKAFTVKAKDVQYVRREIDFNSTEMEDYINKYNLTFYKKNQKENEQLKKIPKTKKALEENGIILDECPTTEVPYTKKECYVERDENESKITNVLWDGMGLIDDSIFPKNMEGFIYCRSHFFKSCLFRGNIQDYFKDHYKDKYEYAVETDMFGRKIKVSDIKVIITENSLKWMKFIDLMGGTKESAFAYYEDFMKKQDEKFAIVKTAHASKWGDIQRSSYQINGSLPTTDEDTLKRIAKLSIDYCNNLKTDEEAYLKHLAITGAKQYSINNVLLALNEWNEDFKYTRYYKDMKKNIISRFKKERLQLGKLFQHGDNLTICGNPIALLMKVTCGQDKDAKQDYLEEGCFQQKDDCIQCYTTRFKDKEKIAGFRSPHNSPNNIVYLENVHSEMIQKYFPKLGNNIIIINGIGTDVQFRLNGQDLDTDGIYATNQKDIVLLAKKAYHEYPTIINGIKQDNESKYSNTMESYAKMDNTIAAQQYAIGYASNIAQLALSYYYHGGGQSQELEDVFIICSVLAQVAIDSAKRSFEIKVSPELKRIRELECMSRSPKYPRFYADVQKLKNKNKKQKMEIQKQDIGDFNCPMDILYRIIDREIIDKRKQKELNSRTVNLNMVFEYDATKIKQKNRRQYTDIISIVKECDNDIKSLDRELEDYSQYRKKIFEKCLQKLRKKTIKYYTMYSLIAYAFHVGGSFCDKLFIILFDLDSEGFLKCFKNTQKV